VWIESQERIVEGLTKIKRSLCAYDSYGKDMVKYDGKEEETVICDCKYGADKNTEGKGCPEVSAARHDAERIRTHTKATTNTMEREEKEVVPLRLVGSLRFASLTYAGV
jgi:hypothetical protein